MKSDLHVAVEEFLTISEYAGERKVSERTVRRWIKEHKVEAAQVGRRRQWRIKLTRFRKVDILSTIATSTT